MENWFSLKGKRVLITGGTGYLGKSMVLALIDSEVEELYIVTSKGIPKEWKSLYFVKEILLPMYHYDILKSKLNTIKVDVIINNAFDFSKKTGFNDFSGGLEYISKQQWDSCMDSGVYWGFAIIQQLIHRMKEKGGSIINIGSMYSIVSPDPDLYEGTKTFNPPCYGASKAALDYITKYVASFYGKYNIRCNTLSPGPFPNTEGYNTPDPKILKKLENKTVLKRVGKPNELIGPLLFLASDASSYVTGQNIQVDGGWTIT